jgi:hypothetical protein
MGVFQNLAGTLARFFQIGGPSGPGINQNGAALEIRNAANSTFAITRGASPVGPNDYVNLSALPFVVYRALGSGQDDAPNVSALLATGSPVQFEATDVYTFLTPMQFGAGADLNGNFATILVDVTAGPGGQETIAGMLAEFSYPVGGPVPLALAADTVPGSLTFEVTATTLLTVGGYVRLYGPIQNCSPILQITKITGGGPFTITVDRPIKYAFPSGGPNPYMADAIIPVLGAHLRNFTLNGSANRLLELPAFYSSVVENIRLVVTQIGGLGMSFDNGCYDSVAYNIQASTNVSGTFWGFFAEANEACTFRDCTATGFGGGVCSYSGRDNLYDNNIVDGNNIGYLLDTNSLFAPFSSDGCVVRGGSASSCSGNGIFGDDLTTGWTIEDVTCNYNANYGIGILPTLGNAPTRNAIRGGQQRFNGIGGIVLQSCSDTQISECDTSNNAVSGVLINATALNTQIDLLRSNGNGAWGVDTGADLLLTNYLSAECSQGGAGGGLQATSAARVTLTDFVITMTHGFGGYGLSGAGTGGIDATSGRVITSGGGVKIGLARRAVAGNDSISDVQINSLFGYYNDVSGSQLKFGANCSVIGTAASWTVDPATPVLTGRILGEWGADSSLTGAVDQYIGVGGRALSSATAFVGALVGSASLFSRVNFSFQGNVLNVGSQTVTVRIQRSTNHGATFTDVTGPSPALPTTAGAHSTSVQLIAPFVTNEGDLLQAILTPSAGLTAALTNSAISVS